MLIIIYIGLLCMPLHVVAYYPRSLFHVMFDNLTKLDTMGLFDDDEETSTTTDDPLTTNQTDETFEELLREPITMNGDLNTLMEVFRTPLGNGELYLNHFNELNLEVYNFTRKRMQAEVGFDQQRYYDLDEPRNLTPARENEKIDKIRMLGLEFLILTRYKIASAMSQRIKVVKDKRYQIGYLFCRLRRIRTEMLKLIVMASEQFKSWWQKRIVTLMRIYQEVIQMQVDARDTILYIRDVYQRYSPHDYQSAILPQDLGGDPENMQFSPNVGAHG